MIPSGMRLYLYSASDRDGLLELMAAPATPGNAARRNAGGAWRLAVLADSEEDLIRKLDRARSGLETPRRERFNLGNRVFFARRENSAPPVVAWVFPGFGAQYPRMAAGWAEAFPSVADWIAGQSARAQAYFQTNPFLAGASRADTPDDPADVSNAVLLMGLFHHVLLRRLGVPCDRTAGHSYGEALALFTAGCIANPWKAIGLPRRVFAEIQSGAERAAFLAAPAAELPPLKAPLHLALDNCPSQQVVCGPPEAVAELETTLRERNVLCFRLPGLDHPVHTPMLDVGADVLREIYGSVEFQPPSVPLHACATAEAVPPDPETIRGTAAAQWTRTVRFRETILSLDAAGVEVFLETGPSGRLCGFIRDTLPGATAIPCDTPNAPSAVTIPQALARLFTCGVPLDETRVAEECRPHAGATGAGVAPEITTNAGDASDAMLELVLRHVAAALEISDRPDPDRGLFEQGLTSLATIALAGRLGAELGREVPPTVFFEAGTPRLLAAHLAGNVRPRVARAGRTAREPIAIVGMACRFPMADSVEGFWTLLAEGRDAITAVPPDRWDSAQWPSAPTRGGFVGDLRGFDAEFFGVSPREAAAMDPQQRMLLETSWRAFEDAGMDPLLVRGRTGAVFVGISGSEYTARLSPSERMAAGGYLATGGMASVAAGRLAHFFGLRGPCAALDTACSSSLAALHCAVQSLRAGECGFALAGGVNALLSPELTVYLAAAGALAPDGRCKTFDAAADGYVRSEGCGMLVLKRLSDAVADGDRIHAVLRGTALNHNGVSGGLTVPNGTAQEILIREALADAGVEPDAVDVIEAHGTGTSLGDPIEVEALGRVFGGNNPRAMPLLLASVKSNMGHLEAAAGAAGVIKLALQLARAEVVPSLHFNSPNPNVRWEKLPVEVCTERCAWPVKKGPGIGGISSFGISGTNVHTVLEAPPPPPRAEPPDRGVSILTVSARGAAALRESAREYDAWLAGFTGSVAEACAASHHCRAHFPFRRAVAGSGVAELRAGLTQPPVPPRPADAAAGVVFLLPGQGSQFAGMGAALYENEPVFKQRLDQCAAELDRRMAPGLLEVLFGDAAEEHLSRTAFTQPAVFAIEYALLGLWESWGIRPAAVIGHSVGEYAAAVAAGVMEFHEALELVHARAALMDALPPGGGMAALRLGQAETTALLEKHGLKLEIAAVNGPDNTVVAGAEEELDRLAGLQPATRLAVSHAFHSRRMESMLEQFAEAVRKVRLRPPAIPFVCNLTGAVGDEVAGAEYWVRQVREPVRFGDGLATLMGMGFADFVEVGPGSVLAGLGRAACNRDSVLWLPGPARCGGGDPRAALAALYERGHAVDWKAVDGGVRVVLPLPGHPWMKRDHWIEAAFCGVGAAQNTPPQATPPPGPSVADDPLAPVVKEFHAASTRRAKGKVLDFYLAAVCRGILGMSQDQSLPADRMLVALGFDSMMAAVLRIRIQRDFAVEVPVAFLIESATPQSLRERILESAERMPAASDWVEGEL